MDSALFETLGSGVLRRCSTQHWGSALGFWMGRLLLAAVRPVLGKRGGWAFDGCRGTLRGGSWKPRALRSPRSEVILGECPRGGPRTWGEASQPPSLRGHPGGVPLGLTSSLTSTGRQGGAPLICEERCSAHSDRVDCRWGAVCFTEKLARCVIFVLRAHGLTLSENKQEPLLYISRSRISRTRQTLDFGVIVSKRKQEEQHQQQQQQQHQ